MQLQAKILLGSLLAAGLAFTAMGSALADRGDHGGRGSQMMQMFERVDLNSDGQITRAELTEYRDRRFGEGDTNGDGALELAEFEEVWLAMARERMVDRFQGLDADGDGRITAAEFDRPLDRLFSRFDRDDDGTVSRSEIRDHRGQGRHRD